MRQLIEHHKRETFLNFFWIIVNQLLNTLTVVLLTFTTNSIVQRSISQFIKWTIINLIVWAIVLISEYGQTVFQERTTQNMLIELRNGISKRIDHKTFNDFHKKNFGNYVSEYVNDVSLVERQSINNTFQIVSDGSAVLFSIVAIASYSFYLLGTTALLTVVMLTIPKILRKPVQTATQNLSEANANFSDRINNIISGFDVFYYLGKLSKLMARTNESATLISNENVAYTKTTARIGNEVAFISILCQVGIDVVTSILAILSMIPIGAISSTGLIAGRIFNGLSRLSNIIVQAKASEPIVARLISNESEKLPIDTGKSTNFKNSISIENLTYNVGGQRIFTNFSLLVNKGDKVAIVGPSGVGKSTLLKILSGQIRDYQGTITIDGKNLSDIQEHQLLAISEYIDQSGYIFNDSVRNNISIWDDSIEDNKIENAMRRSMVNFIEDYDTIIDENGQNLSGGQKQRLGLSRFFYNPKPIVYLDECLSQLDANTATKVNLEFLNDKKLTLFEVTHHLNPLLKDKYDQVIELNY